MTELSTRFGFRAVYFTSFTRQLNLYGFRKTSRPDEDYFEFSHDLFTRDNPGTQSQVCRDIRTTTSGKRSREENNEEPEDIQTVKTDALSLQVRVLERRVHALEGVFERVLYDQCTREHRIRIAEAASFEAAVAARQSLMQTLSALKDVSAPVLGSHLVWDF